MYLFKHRNNWADEYLAESTAITKNYGAAIEIHHIGSTAVPGLHSKDCIDILGVVEGLSQVAERTDKLITLDYEYKGAYGIDKRMYFSKIARKVHLHIFETNDVNIDRHLKFVEIMRAKPNLVEELNAIKKELHKKFPNNKEAYQTGKKHFYDKIHRMI